MRLGKAGGSAHGSSRHQGNGATLYTLVDFHLDQFAALLGNVSREVCPHHLFEPRNRVRRESGEKPERTQIGHEALDDVGHHLKLGLVVVDDGGEQLIIGALGSGSADGIGVLAITASLDRKRPIGRTVAGFASRAGVGVVGR